MNVIDIINDQEAIPVDVDLVGQWTVRILSILGREEVELSVLLIDDARIRELNREYLGRDRPTNVISFPQQEGDGPEGNHLGDVVISLERAAQEAEDAGMETTMRLRQLLVHGICHLCGYDHEDVSDETTAKMEAAEQRVLSLLDKEPA
ncbi:MAG TPA: rRNA maturation RNase YbeY [Deltaproteobacteria bacterium]|nr:rRNA maturation RNase YbeY [Deltaproteobacteria bacterium]HPR55376.1 rRNA maturation RNase YbeY [Deltaproteobacteria bacterium]HXK48358.1 rRNA maturation RNase YbeY [Deltaproteobacteria bacterium]